MKVKNFNLVTTISVIVGISQVTSADLKFPKNFLIGVATSSYQNEGAWNESGKAESNWDHFAHNHPNLIKDRSNADVSTDSYHKYMEDVELVKNIGFDHYRFSISWPRVLPLGDTSVINKEGVKYYHNILDELEKRGIKPFVTIYNWDHPQKLEDEFGGWLDEKMAYSFDKYAEFIYKEYGHRVQFFTTINEPYLYCTTAFLRLIRPDLIGKGEYQCIHNILKGHALAYHTYDNKFRSVQKGQIGIANPCFYSYPKNECDSETSDIAFEFMCGWASNPIYSKNGDYPEIMKERIAERSRLQGYNVSRLPIFSESWINLIRGSYDYFGLNHFTSDIVESLPDDKMLDWPGDDGLKHSSDPNWQTAQSPWIKIVPDGLGNLLRQIKEKYDNPPVYILENGVSDGNGTYDNMRIDYISSYAKSILTAIQQDGCDVRSYTYWSLLDNFGWAAGFTTKFGLYEVDFKDENRKRFPKKSAEWFKNVLTTRSL